MKTTIDFNGLRIEHNGGESVLLISEAPTKIAISDLIIKSYSWAWMSPVSSPSFFTRSRTSVLKRNDMGFVLLVVLGMEHSLSHKNTHSNTKIHKD